MGTRTNLRNGARNSINRVGRVWIIKPCWLKLPVMKVLRIKTVACPDRGMRRLGLAVCMLFMLSIMPPASAGGSATQTCLYVNRDLSLGTRLPRLAARIDAGGPVRIVAIGSSSTVGLWMVRPSLTYPQVMKRELETLWPGIAFEIVNSGRVGDTIPGNIKRFRKGVFAHRPDLVIWQLGVNDIAWGGNMDGVREEIDAGVASLKATGVDLILMDLQYAPQVLASPHHAAMEVLIRVAALQEGVGLFSRFEAMLKSVQAGVSDRALVALDGLHNSRDGYDCIGRLLARAIHAAVQE